MGYHKKEIKRGVFGEFSKIVEEFEELTDAHDQNNPIMELIELSDLIGSIEAYCKKRNISLNDLLTMKKATESAFIDGSRLSR
jgi:hypothetical protein